MRASRTIRASPFLKPMAIYTTQAGRTVFPTVCAGVSRPGAAVKPSQGGPSPGPEPLAGAAEDRGFPPPRPPSEGHRPRTLSARSLWATRLQSLQMCFPRFLAGGGKADRDRRRSPNLKPRRAIATAAAPGRPGEQQLEELPVGEGRQHPGVAGRSLEAAFKSIPSDSS